MEKENRKEQVRNYKEKRYLGGIYSITNRVTGEKHLFTAMDLNGARNRFTFMQQTGSCINLSLSKEWKEYGADQFCFEVVEELEQKETQTTEEFRADMTTLAQMWNVK